MAILEPPLYSCEAVLSEACFLLRHLPGGQLAVLDLLHRELVKIDFRLEVEAAALRNHMERYSDLPTSIADGCLVRMAEIREGSRVLTIDTDFLIYRIHGRQTIPTILPAS